MFDGEEFDEFRKALTQRHAAFEAWWAELKRQGYTLDETTFAVPIQLFGTLPTGELFYFRCRWDSCRLDIGGDDPVRAPEWSEELSDPAWSEFEAGWLEAEEAREVFEQLFARWRVLDG